MRALLSKRALQLLCCWLAAAAAVGTTPTGQPTRQPTTQPSHQPSNQPSITPSNQPTNQPQSRPSRQPSAQPSSQPTSQPMGRPSSQPSIQPSTQPTAQPSRQPTGKPSKQPTSAPTNPTSQPSRQPSSQPSRQPTRQPSPRPSRQPSRQPTAQPSSRPTSSPKPSSTMIPTAAGVKTARIRFTLSLTSNVALSAAQDYTKTALAAALNIPLSCVTGVTLSYSSTTVRRSLQSANKFDVDSTVVSASSSSAAFSSSSFYSFFFTSSFLASSGLTPTIDSLTVEDVTPTSAPVASPSQQPLAAADSPFSGTSVIVVAALAAALAAALLGGCYCCLSRRRLLRASGDFDGKPSQVGTTPTPSGSSGDDAFSPARTWEPLSAGGWDTTTPSKSARRFPGRAVRFQDDAAPDQEPSLGGGSSLTSSSSSSGHEQLSCNTDVVRYVLTAPLSLLSFGSLAPAAPAPAPTEAAANPPAARLEDFYPDPEETRPAATGSPAWPERRRPPRD